MESKTNAADNDLTNGLSEEKRPLASSAEDLARDSVVNDNGNHIKGNGQLEAAKAKEMEGLLDPPMKSMETESKPISDRYMFVYFILMIHGIGTLMPWNMFITATEYFTEHKLKGPPCGDFNETGTAAPDIDGTYINYDVAMTNVTSKFFDILEEATTMASNVTTCQETSSAYRNYFLSYLGFVAQVPNVILNAINVFARVKGGDISKRIIWSIIVVVVMFIFTVLLAMLDSSSWPDMFFWITMVIVVIINMANGVYQNSVYGTAAILPMKYTNAVVLGSNTSGTLTSVIMLISIASTPNPRTSAIYYFLAAIFVLLIAFDLYYILPFMPFYRHYKDMAERQQEVKVKEVKDESSGSSSSSSSDDSVEFSTRPEYMLIFRKCWKQFFGVWFVFFVTLTCFPAIQANVKKVDGDGFPIPEKYFTGVTCFLFFNFFAMVGNLTTEFIRKPGPRWVWIPIVLRVLFIPFFMFCNFQPTSGLRQIPVLINNNWVYSIGSIIMAFTSGYFSSLTMMYAPGEVDKPEHKGVAGMMAAFFLILGIFSGVIFSIPVTLLVESL